jgi:hypothetical protein
LIDYRGKMGDKNEEGLLEGKVKTKRYTGKGMPQ